jgi:hypothetical protein
MLTVSGASDDLIEVEGDIREEFGHLDDAPALIAVSDGTLLRVRYDEEGIWRITVVRTPDPSAVTKVEGVDDRDHTDKVTIAGPVAWVVYTTPGRDDRTVHALAGAR